MPRQVPWGRLGAEGAVIVFSILLAFAIQAWWEGSQERKQEIRHLAALRSELEVGLEIIPGAKTTIANMLHSHVSLTRQFPGDALAPEDSLFIWLSDLSRPGNLRPPTAVFDDLVSSGGIQLIKSDLVRLAIADYQRLLGIHQTNIDQAWATWAERMQPFLEGRVPRGERLRRGSYGAEWPVPLAPSPFPPDFASMFNDPSFSSMIAERWMRLDQAARNVAAIGSLMEELIALIDEELGAAE